MRAAVFDGDGRPIAENFLIDSGADRTVFSQARLSRLRLPTTSASTGVTLSGIGGASAFVVVTTAVEFIRDDGGAVRVRVELRLLLIRRLRTLASSGVTSWTIST